MNTTDLQPDVNFTWHDILGVTALISAAICQLLALFTTRIITKVNPGLKLSCFIRSWIHGAGFLEQITFLIFHFTYILPWKDWDDVELCFILRGMMSMTSCATVMWLLMLAVFYSRLAIKQRRCLWCNSRPFAVCVTWTWALSSALTYQVLIFYMKDDNRYSQYVKNCWTHINGTLHVYFAYANEIGPLIPILLFVVSARILLRKNMSKSIQNPLKKRAHFKRKIVATQESKHLKYKVEILLYMAIMMCIYYIGFAVKLNYSKTGLGSDLYVMCSQATKGLMLALSICFLEKDTLAMFRCLPSDAKQRHGFDQEENAKMIHVSKSTKKDVIEL